MGEAEAIGTAADITRAGITIVNVKETVITGTAAEPLSFAGPRRMQTDLGA